MEIQIFTDELTVPDGEESAAATPPNPPAPDLAALVADEVKSVIHVFKKFAGSNYSAETYLGTSVQDFVHHCMVTHMPLIRRWGGWRYHSAPMTVEEINDQTQLEIVDRMLIMLRMSYPALLARMSLSISHPDWLPNITTIPTALRRRTVSLPAGVKVAQISYAHGAYAPARHGQAVSRVVLTHLKKLYPGEKEYLQLWDRLFQMLGQGWAAAKPFALTLSAAPSSFMRLGHYGENSCVRFGSEWAKGKKMCAVVPNSVVAMMYNNEKPIATPTRNGRGRVGLPQYRSWGIAEPGQFVFLSNDYLMARAASAPLLSRALAQSIGLPPTLELDYEFHHTSNPGIEHPFQQLSSAGISYVNSDSGMLFASSVSRQAKNLYYEQCRNASRLFVDSTTVGFRTLVQSSKLVSLETLEKVGL